MKMIEIKGFWGFLGFIGVALVLLLLVVGLPVTLTWVTWNLVIADYLNGPQLDWWQAALLSAMMAVILKLVYQPEIQFEVKRMDDPDEAERSLKRFKEQDSRKK